MKPERKQPPEHLGDEGRRVWREMYGQLTDAGILTDADLSAFVLLCEAFDNVRRCDLTLQETGEFYTSPKGQILRHPQAVQRDKYVQERSALLRQFGMMPLARRTLKPKKLDKQKEKPIFKPLNG